MSEHAETATWWTPSGWITAPPPDAYRRALTSTGRYEFKKTGYSPPVTIAGIISRPDLGQEVRTRSHPGGHIIVEISVDDFVETLFVEQKFIAAFYLDRMPALMSAIAQQAVAELLAESVERSHPPLTPSKPALGARGNAAILAFANRSPAHGSAR